MSLKSVSGRIRAARAVVVGQCEQVIARHQDVHAQRRDIGSVGSIDIGVLIDDHAQPRVQRNIRRVDMIDLRGDIRPDFPQYPADACRLVFPVDLGTHGGEARGMPSQRGAYRNTAQLAPVAREVAFEGTAGQLEIQQIRQFQVDSREGAQRRRGESICGVGSV